MRNIFRSLPRVNRWLVFSAVSLAFFFLNLSTFASLGVVLYTMVAELHWTLTAAGFSFSVLGLACGLSSPLPAMCLHRWGGRWTLVSGCVSLCVGFCIAAGAHGILAFYVSMLLLGFSFSMAGNIPGVYLIAAWFERGTTRVIGFYLMAGALGAACGPLIVEAIVSGPGGWRSHWRWMAVASALIAVYCCAFVREVEREGGVMHAAPAGADEGAAGGAKRGAAAAPQWNSRDAVFTAQFALAAAAMALTMTTVTTYSSDVVTHLVKLGATPAAGARMLSVIAVAATVIKGAAGRLCELLPSARVLAAGLICQALGSLILAHAGSPLWQLASAVTFGVGWGLAYVSATVVPLDFFGGVIGAKILSIVWLLSTVAAAGPLAAGMVADRFDTFVPVFNVFAALLVILAIPIYFMRAPVRRSAVPAPRASLAARQPM